MKFLKFFLLSLAVVSLSQLTVYANSDDLDVSLSINNDVDYFGEMDQIIVNFSLINNGEEPVHILEWETPLRAVENDIFEVMLDGEPVAYRGRLYKRQSPTEEDFIKLGPGERITRDVNLTSLYDFSQPGSYSIQYRTMSSLHLSLLTSDTVEVWIDGHPLADSEDTGYEMAKVKAGSISYVKCTAKQKKDLAAAHASAKTIASESHTYLGKLSKTSKRYKTWFGTYDDKRKKTVHSTFNKITDALNNKAVSYNCNCNSSTYGYVDATKPYKITLCKAFWTASLTGTDSRSGVVIHEMSHFNVVAGTKDHVYGTTAAKNLAKKSAAKAIENADNVEYFAENTPKLP